MKLSIVIVSFNTRDDTVRCIESLLAAPPAVDFEIVVVDNASSDDSVAVLRERFPGVRVIQQSSNLGFAGANNVGIRATASELVLLLNSDTIVPAGAIDALVGRLRVNPRAALLVHRRDAEAVGLLDERYFLYTEDVDFCASIRARGRAVLFTPAATITHLRGRSRATAPKRMNAAYRRSQIAFYEKHHPRWAPLLRAYLKAKGEL